MRINNIKFGEQELNFLNDSHEPHKIIVFVGDNGSGKTTLLKKISDLRNVENNKKCLFIQQDIKYREALHFAGNEMGKLLDGSDTNGRTITRANRKNEKVYDLINSDFLNMQIKNKYMKIKDMSDLFLGIGKQVGSIKIVGDEFYRPQNSFVDIDFLSSGEQEILLRLQYLSENFTDDFDILMIDEPETALHPKWQQKIIEMYKILIKDDQQLFIATHSENILKEALKDKDCLVIKLNMAPENRVYIERVSNSDRAIPWISFAEIQYLVFDIISNDYHNELYGQLPRKRVKSCDDFILQHAKYDRSKHYKSTAYEDKTYYTLTTYIRNEIDHPPQNGKTYTEEQLRTSIELLRGILKPKNILKTTTIDIFSNSQLDFTKYYETLNSNIPLLVKLNDI